MEGLRVEWASLPQNSGILGGSRPMIDIYVRERVRDIVRQENAKIAAEIKKIDAELRKGYALLDTQWGEFYRYYFTLQRGPGTGMTLGKMMKTCLNNTTQWQRLAAKRKQLGMSLALPRTFDAVVSLDRPNVSVAVRITVPGNRDLYQEFTLQ